DHQRPSYDRIDSPSTTGKTSGTGTPPSRAATSIWCSRSTRCRSVKRCRRTTIALGVPADGAPTIQVSFIAPDSGRRTGGPSPSRAAAGHRSSGSVCEGEPMVENLSEELTIRAYQPSDQPGFEALVRDVHGEFGLRYDRRLDADLTRPEEHYSHIFVLVEGERICGTAALTAPAAGVTTLKRMYVT